MGTLQNICISSCTASNSSSLKEKKDIAPAWIRYEERQKKDLAEKRRRATEERKQEQKQWKQEERARGKAAKKAHLEDLCNQIMAPFKASSHNVSVFHPSATAAPQGLTWMDEPYEEKISPKLCKTLHGGPAPSQDSMEVDTLVNHSLADTVRCFPISYFSGPQEPNLHFRSLARVSMLRWETLSASLLVNMYNWLFFFCF